METATDETALVLGNDSQVFIALMTKLHDQNLSEAEPSQWVKLLFYDHLTYNEGLKLVNPDTSGYFSL
jgi:STE24 endopeptidase